MNPIFADFNAMTESGQVRLNCRGSQDDLRAADLHPGDWAWLSDGELMVCGKIDSSPDTGIVAVPDWKTLVHLDDPHDVAAVGRELTDLLKRENPSVDELWRLFRVAHNFRADRPSSGCEPVPTRLLLVPESRDAPSPRGTGIGRASRSKRHGDWNRVIRTTIAYSWKSCAEPICHERPARPSL